jgi:hypothetical protein
MSAYIILREPHPLDAIWTIANEEVERASDAIEATPDDVTDAQLNAAGEVLTRAVLAIMALPARNFDDIITKLMLTGIEDGPARNDRIRDILNEACLVLDAAIQRGKQRGEASDAGA